MEAKRIVIALAAAMAVASWPLTANAKTDASRINRDLGLKKMGPVAETAPAKVQDSSGTVVEVTEADTGILMTMARFDWNSVTTGNTQGSPEAVSEAEVTAIIALSAIEQSMIASTDRQSEAIVELTETDIGVDTINTRPGQIVGPSERMEPETTTARR